MTNLNELYNRFLNGESITKLSKEIDVSRETLTKKFIKNCGYVRQSKKNITNKITDKLLDEAYSLYKNKNESISSIARKFNINRKSLSRKMKERYNIEILADGKKRINSLAFSKLTKDSSYWLGIMITDGYINKDNSGFELSLKDKEHIEKFKTFLQSKHKIQERVITLNDKLCYAYRISIKDRTIVNDLNKWGCINNKSFIVRLPHLEEELMPSLIRGIFDGDGCISITNKKLLSICSASYLFLKDVYEYLLSKGVECTAIRKSRNLYSLNISTKKDNFIKFYDFLYKDSNYTNRLNRKYEKYTKNLPS